MSWNWINIFLYTSQGYNWLLFNGITHRKGCLPYWNGKGVFGLSSRRGDEITEATYFVFLPGLSLFMDEMLLTEWGAHRAIAATEMAVRVNQGVRGQVLTYQSSQSHNYCTHILRNILARLCTDPGDEHVKVCLTGVMTWWSGSVVRDRRIKRQVN